MRFARGPRRVLVAAASLAGACATIALVARVARAQRIDPRRGRTILVGAPRGSATADRVDSARSGFSRAPLPTGTLHVAWRRSLGLPIDVPPLVDARGDVIVLTARGDVVVLAADGEERTHTSVGAAAATSAALLSDDTVVFVSAGSDAIGVRLGDVRFRTHLGGERVAVAPLALDDGGFVVATRGELIALDGEGNVRARAAIDPSDPPEHALLGARGSKGPDATVYAVTASGALLAWLPASGRDVARVGSFGGPTEGGVALSRAPDGVRALAVVGAQLVALDPSGGALATLGGAATSGALALFGPPAAHAGVVSVLGVTASRTIALSFGQGGETLHEAVASSFLPSLPDGGAALGSIPIHVGPLVDAAGAVAFALPSGELGVVSPSGAVDLVGDVCARFGATSSALAALGVRGGAVYAGLAPAGPSAVVVACGSGVVARIDSDFAPSP